MIFPNVRISELKKEVDAKRALYESSKTNLNILLKSKMRPLTFIKDHPQLILGSLFTLFSTTSTFGKTFGGSPFGGRKGLLGRLVRVGWAWKLFKVGKTVYRS